MIVRKENTHSFFSFFPTLKKKKITETSRGDWQHYVEASSVSQKKK